MIFVPLNGQVVVKRTSSEKVTKGGIVLPDGAQKESQKGVVMAVFNEYADEDGKVHKPRVKPGDVVLFPKYEGEEFEMPPWGKILLMKGTAIRGIILDDPETESEDDGSEDSYEQKTRRLTHKAYAEVSS